MIHIQLNRRVYLPPGQPLLLRDAAIFSGPQSLAALQLPCPEKPGIWKLPAAYVARAVQSECPGADVSLLGAEICYIHRQPRARRDATLPLRTALAFLILFLGSALGLAWFHSDVDMPHAQLAVYQAITGNAPRDERLITVPYAIGVALGVAVFYALPARSATTPLEMKLAAYRADMEEAEGMDIE